MRLSDGTDRGIPWRGNIDRAAHDARAAEMAELHRSGSTFAAIGLMFGVSRQRAAQIVARYNMNAVRSKGERDGEEDGHPV